MYLVDMQVALGWILEDTKGMGYHKFKNDRKTLHAVLMYFTIIGEAAKNIPDSVKQRYPEVPWKKMYALRNVVSHGYFAIESGQLWEIIENNIPNNKKQIDRILDAETQ